MKVRPCALRDGCKYDGRLERITQLQRLYLASPGQYDRAQYIAAVCGPGGSAGRPPLALWGITAFIHSDEYCVHRQRCPRRTCAPHAKAKALTLHPCRACVRRLRGQHVWQVQPWPWLRAGRALHTVGP